MVSTPNAPEGLFERIEKEAEDVCLYKRIFLDYTYGIGKIYTQEEIEKAKQSPSFEREYNLKYLSKIGNVFHTKDIEAAIEKGRKYNPDNIIPFTSTSMGIDPASYPHHHIQIMHAKEYTKPDYNEMLSIVYSLMSKYSVDKVYIDGANPSFIRSLKMQIGEDPDYDKVIARYRSDGFGDEADFFPPGQQQDARDVSERYIAKSNPYIVMVSTPNAPEGLFEGIEKEAADTCLYKRIFLDYTYGISKIYTAEEIEKAKQSPSFEREYNLKYLGKIGNVFHTKDIEAAIEKGRKYNPDNFDQSYYTSTSMGIDPAYGSSAFGIVITRFADGIVQILYAEEYHRPDYNEMLSMVYGLMVKYNVDKVYIDGANPSFIKSLKLQIGEDADYDKVIARYRSEGLGDDATKDMRIVPVNFSKEHKAMLGHCKMILEQDPGKIAINPDKFDKLITSLRTAVDNDGTLDKESTSYNDIFDAFRLALKFYRFEDSSSN
ncbi:MAG: hypothetical protein ACJ71G_05645 [Nitrososphaeraceae archaeon]